jgi:Phage terminase large subunit
MRDFEMRGAARDLLAYRGTEALAAGPAGTGKSIAMLLKLHITLARVPNCKALLLRQTHASLTASTLVSFEQQIASEELATGKVKWFGGSGRQAPGYLYPNGSKLSVGGLDRPGKVLSTEYDRVAVDESNQISITAYETLLTRLRGHADTYKQIILACNPDHPDHWLKKRAETGVLAMFHSVHQDNPRLYDRHGQVTEGGREYIALLDALTGIRRARYRDGIWAAAEGLVFDEWRDGDNIIETLPDMTGWPLVLSVDWGFSNPLVVQWWRIDPDGRMWLTREIHQTRTLVEDVARQVRQIMNDHPEEPYPAAVVCDHDSEDRATFERHAQLATIPARKSVSRGVQLVQSRVRKAGDGRPRLLVWKHALQGRDDVAEREKRPRGFLGEVNGYVWMTERGTDGIPKEVPVKKHDHSMDAGRYAVAHLDWNEPVKVGNPAAQQAASTGQGGVAGGVFSRPVGR